MIHTNIVIVKDTYKYWEKETENIYNLIKKFKESDKLFLLLLSSFLNCLFFFYLPLFHYICVIFSFYLSHAYSSYPYNMYFYIFSYFCLVLSLEIHIFLYLYLLLSLDLKWEKRIGREKIRKIVKTKYLSTSLLLPLSSLFFLISLSLFVYILYLFHSLSIYMFHYVSSSPLFFF